MTRSIKSILVALCLSLALTSTAFAQTDKDVHYGEGALQEMDIYPAAVADSPLVMLVHGGGWVSGDKKGLDTPARELQAEGFAVFNTDYRLASLAEKTEAFPMEAEDVQKATEYAMAHAATYNASASKVFLIGGSAGGNLVEEATIRLNEAKAETVRGTVALSGASDLWTLVEANRGFGEDLVEALGVANLQPDAETPEKEALAKAYSPARHLVASTKSVAWQLFESQENELMPKDQYDEMKAAIEGLSGNVTGRLVARKAHAFAYWGSVEAEIYSFIKTHE